MDSDNSKVEDANRWIEGEIAEAGFKFQVQHLDV